MKTQIYAALAVKGLKYHLFYNFINRDQNICENDTNMISYSLTNTYA